MSTWEDGVADNGSFSLPVAQKVYPDAEFEDLKYRHKDSAHYWVSDEDRFFNKRATPQRTSRHARRLGAGRAG